MDAQNAGNDISGIQIFWGSEGVLPQTPPIHAWYIGHTRGLQPLLSPHGKILKKGPETKYLKTLHPIRGLHLRDLTLKITMLIALLSGQRCQTIHALDISDMQVVCHPN